MKTRVTAMSIAGSDCSGGAGIQADLKTFEAFGVHGLTAVSCVVSETARTVREIWAVPPEFLASQVELLLEELPVKAIKTGMLFSAAHLRAIMPILRKFPALPLVVDPVMVASTGSSLAQDDFVPAAMELMKFASLVTPNLDEAAVLLGAEIGQGNFRDAGLALFEKFRVPILLKGGHLGGEICTDLLVESATKTREFSSPRVHTAASHGTGCTLSAAIAAGLAKGKSLEDAVGDAKNFLNQALTHGYALSEEIAALRQSWGGA